MLAASLVASSDTDLFLSAVHASTMIARQAVSVMTIRGLVADVVADAFVAATFLLGSDPPSQQFFVRNFR